VTARGRHHLDRGTLACGFHLRHLDFFEIALDDDGHRDGERGTVARVRGARPGQRPKQPQSPLLVNQGKLGS